jgi:LDH2 family malate/lactate/ureidoglycolate dehydrogenase
MISEIKALPKNPGVEELFVPGEIEQRRRKERKEKGIEISDVVYQELKGLGKKYNVSFYL